MFCTKCGTALAPSAKFCEKCGASQEITTQSNVPPIAENSSPSNPEEFYKAIIGPKNQGYYLNHFTRFDGAGKAGASWHWPAFFFTFYWLLYRKMWRNAFIYFLLPYIVMIPIGVAAAMAGGSADAVTGIGYFLFLIAAFTVPPMYANALYYKHCKNKIAQTSSTSQDMQRQLGELSGKGGTSRVVMVIIAFTFIAVIGILAAVAIPAYSDYTTKAKASEGITLGNSASLAVDVYSQDTGKIPATLKEAGFITTTGKYVSNVTIDPENAEISVTFGTTGSSQLDGKKLKMTPSQNTDKTFSWKCSSDEIAARYLPLSCR